jgi:short-subunit dehydrogenase
MASVLITGCRRGIGLDVAQRLLSDGHRVYATVHRQDSVEEVKEKLGPEAIVQRLDITDPSDRAMAAEWWVDVLINNAALADTGPLAEIDVDRIRELFETNVFATLELTQVVLRQMIQRHNGRIIFIGSLAGLVPTPYMAPYAMTKFALESVAFALRGELEPFNIDVTMINPGPYDTGFNREMMASKYEWLPEDSVYQNHLNLMRREDQKLRLIEKSETSGIAEKIVEAVEAEKPKGRYSAPKWQRIAAPFRRLRGK